MRVNPQYLNNVVGALDQTTAVQQQLTEELSTGSAVQQLSDNPIVAGRNVLLSAAVSAASSSLGSCVSTAIAVAASIGDSRANASPGQATITCSAAGNRSDVAKRARGSTTNGVQSATLAASHS